MDLVLYHHNHTKSNYPDLCSILKKADHHSASEREDIDDTQEVNKTPLISLFSKIVLEGNDKVDEQYIPLNKLSLDDGSFNNLKPAAKKDTMGGWNLVPEYNRLWDEFNFEFELIQNKTDFNTLLALLKKYASTMPSAAYKSKSDISLYDHSKTTAALAVSRYLFNRDGDVKLTQKDDLNCYLAIEGDISGIQKFIFKISSPQEAQSGMSKRLRGRSLYLTLLCDAIATYIAEELELCEANILFCGGGRFTIIGPNTKMAKEKLAEIKSKLNKFFIDEFNAELYLALVSIECCGDDLAKFGQITRKLSNKLNEDKKHKFSDNLDEVFNFDEEIKYDDLCSVCGTPYPKKEGSVVCKTCRKHEKLGQNAANADYMIKCITDKGEGYFIEPANVDYHFLNKSRDIADKINSLSKTCKKVEVIKLNDTNFLDLANHEFESNVSFSFSFMGNTVPNLGRFADNHKYMPLYFEHLAKISNGANKLGVLKMDVDNLGLIFSEGLKESYDENLGISRVSALSSQLDMFFSGFVNNIASEFKVYSKVFDEDKFDKKELEIQNDNEEIKESVFVYKLKYGCELSDDGEDKLKDYEIPTKETWYKLTTKALLDTGQYDKCINLSTEALLNLSEFTYDNDVWFKWRIAKSFNQLGEYDQSVDYLNDIKQFKNDWFIDNLMAENYFFKNDWDNALKYALSAALAKGDTDKKVNLYSLIEDILNKKNKQKEADIHAYLVYTIRKRHNWNIDENLEYKIEKAGFDLDNEDYFTIEKHLHHLWEEYLYKNQELKKGVIVSVLPNKKAGFIRCDEYPDNLYFSMNEFKHNITLAKTGQNVTFYEADGFDKKKNKQVKNAVNIYLNGG